MSKLPLAARHGVHRVLEEFRQTSEKGDYSQRAKVAAYIAFVVGQHMVQAALGLDIGLGHAEKGGSTLEYLQAAYDGFYTATSLGVVYATMQKTAKFTKLWHRPVSALQTSAVELQLDPVEALEAEESVPEAAIGEDLADKRTRDWTNTIALNAMFFYTAAVR